MRLKQTSKTQSYSTSGHRYDSKIEVLIIEKFAKQVSSLKRTEHQTAYSTGNPYEFETRQHSLNNNEIVYKDEETSSAINYNP